MMPKDELDKLFEDHYIVGEIQRDLPVYPLFSVNPASPDGKPELKAYVFESSEIVSVRGYSGKPINILVVVDLSGQLLSARLLDHKEPIFLDAYGVAKLTEFAAQYKGLSVRHKIEINKATDTPARNEHTAVLRGVHRGTISAKAINRTIMSAAAKVALARLNIKVVDHGDDKSTDVDAAAAGSVTDPKNALPSSSQDTKPAANHSPKAVSSTEVPSALSASSAASGSAAEKPTSPVANASESIALPPSQDARLAKSFVTQSDGNPRADAPSDDRIAASESAGADTLAGTASVKRSDDVYRAEKQDLRDEWWQLWTSRRVDIAIVALGLLVLSVGLIAQKRLSAGSRRFRVLRTTYLVFTLGFIGWAAQGQLTIVNITAALASLASGGDLDFLMNDPITVMLWIFVGFTLLVWGRGTFCGWLCPFGALQELVSLLANAVGLRQKRLRTAWDAKLKWIKYVILSVLIASLYLAPDVADMAVEIEPFKTAISFYFQRDWPYVLWALACVFLSIFLYRGYCRYLCPLGAALAATNVLQRWSWIPRRSECGTPCQSCRHRCEYQAIAPTGKVDYSECFQCLDCVSIYQDSQRCLPLIQDRRQHDATTRVIPLHVAGSA